jgi:pilus assembly protein CpaE
MAKVLIIDDDLDSLKLTGLMLQGRGYQIIAAQNGPQGLSKAVSEGPDLVILDIMMPGMDGMEVCRRLRANPRTQPIPIIMFTAKSQIEDKVAGFAAGADEYLTKPIHPAELVTRVEALISRAARMGPTMPTALLQAKGIGFLGCKGGVGTSTLAANTAIALTQGPAAEQKVTLVDFRTTAATVAVQLGLRPQQTLQNLSQRPIDSLDAETVLSRVDRHNSGLTVLSGQPAPAGTAPALDAAHVEVIARHLGKVANYLLIDMGTGLEAVNQSLLRMLTYLVVVTEPQRIALLMAQNLLASLDALEMGQQKVGVVAVHRAPAAVTLTKEMIEGLLQRPVIATISPAPELAFQAADKGMPMIMLQPDSLPSRQIRQLAEFLVSV